MPGVATAGRLVDDRYRLLEELERGGMGILWRAEDLITERDVVVKELRFPDPLDHMQRRALAARVRREARAMAAVEHPGVVRILDVIDDGDRPWVVSEWVDAPTLAQVVAADGPLAPERAALLGLSVLDILEAVHEEGQVHRFLQPAKVLVTADGGARVADFGIASLIGDRGVASNGAVSGVDYMAPEQAGTPEADLWSLGAVLYFAVEGVPPFAEDGDRTADDPPRPAQAAGSLGLVLDATLVKDPSDRPDPELLESMLEMAAGELAVRPGPSPEADDRGDDDGGGDDDGLVTEAIIWPESEFDTKPSDMVWAAPEADADAPSEPDNVEQAVEQVDEEPPAPLSPAVALSRMFSPDPGRPRLVVQEPDIAVGPPPPWPVVHRRGVWTVVLCGLVGLVLVALMITNGRALFGSKAKSAAAIAAIKWSGYTDPDTGFTMDIPANWSISREGQFTDFRDPAGYAALRVVVQPTSTTTAVDAWNDLEKRFIGEHSSYKRIRIEPKSFRTHDAAEWEFSYLSNGIEFHNLDLGVITAKNAYALNFEGRASSWDAVSPLMQRFSSSFRPQ